MCLSMCMCIEKMHWMLLHVLGSMAHFCSIVISCSMAMLPKKGNCEIRPSLTSLPFSQSSPFQAKNNHFDQFLMAFDSELSGFALFCFSFLSTKLVSPLYCILNGFFASLEHQSKIRSRVCVRFGLLWFLLLLLLCI